MTMKELKRAGQSVRLLTRVNGPLDRLQARVAEVWEVLDGFKVRAGEAMISASDNPAVYGEYRRLDAARRLLSTAGDLIEQASNLLSALDSLLLGRYQELETAEKNQKKEKQP
jgi:hypothetical protein